MNRFILNYVDDNRQILYSAFPDFNTFKNDFIVDDKIIGELKDFVNNNDFDYKNDDIESSLDDIELVIKARIAGDMWTTSNFYEIINEQDIMVLKAIEIMDNWSEYKNKLLNN